jgi:hypothetical protein
MAGHRSAERRVRELEVPTVVCESVVAKIGHPLTAEYGSV